jgi:hypothetical protein
MRAPLIGVTLLLGAGAAAQPRPVQIISRSAEIHRAAAISPDGTLVAFAGSGRIGAVDIGGAADRTLVSSATLGTFVWAADSTGVFFVDGTAVKFVGRNGGNPVTLSTPAGSAVWLWDVSPDNRVLYGTRYDPGPMMFHLFTLGTSGTSSAMDRLSSFDSISDVRLDPSRAYLLFRSAPNMPAAMVSYWRVDVDGRNPIDLFGQPVGTFGASGRWLDAGDTIVFDGVIPGVGLQLLRLNRTRQLLEPMTSFSAHQRANLAGDQSWLVLESVDGIGGNSPGLLPPDGGAVVQLSFGTAYQYTSSPTIDAQGRFVVFSASRMLPMGSENAKIFKITLDRELRIHPRAEIGRAVSMELPVASNEWGLIMLSGGMSTTPFTIPGIADEFWLDASFSILQLAPPTGGLVTFQLPIPAIPQLRGIRLFTQGARVNPTTTTGDFGRLTVFTIF